MKIATWNVNSIKARLPHLLAWLKAESPDIALLQETKCTDDNFPRLELEDLGYNLAFHGEKSYNGVAILSKHPLEDVTRGLPGGDEDSQARYIEAVVSVGNVAFRIASVYVPNGQSPDSEKFPYKLRFLERLRTHAARLLEYEEMLVIGGDYNVAPNPIDIYDPVRLNGTTCFHPEERTRLHALLHLGLYDAFRLRHPEPGQYTFWDYRAGAFDMNAGYRIDYLLLSPQAADRLQDCKICKDIRALEKPSDHAPVLATFAV